MLPKGIDNVIDMKKFFIIIIVMLIIWSSLFVLFWKKGTALQTHPCSVCAKHMGKNVLCISQGSLPLTIIFNENGTITDNSNEISQNIRKVVEEQWKNLNISVLEGLANKI